MRLLDTAFILLAWTVLLIAFLVFTSEKTLGIIISTLFDLRREFPSSDFIKSLLS